MFAFLAEGKSLLRFGKGTTHTTIYFPEVRAFHICMPIRTEQERIVALIRQMRSKTSRLREELGFMPSLVRQLRQSVLASAFRGDLTADWREQNSNIDPASELLKQIDAERRRIWEEAELGRMRARGKAPADGRRKMKYEEPKPLDDPRLSELPQEWVWTNLESITDPVRVIRYGILMPGPNQQEGVPYVKVMHIRGDRIDFGSLPRTTREIDRKFAGAKLRVGDVLLAIRGTYGRVAEVPPALDGANITQDSARITPIPGVRSSFLANALRAPFCQEYFKNSAKGMAVQGLNVGDVRLTPIALPPEAEQEEIARRVQQHNASISFIEAELEQVGVDLESLDRAILAKAFRGELVPQEPSDEPAALLLDRIKTERECGSTPRARCGRSSPRPRRSLKLAKG